MTEQRPPEGDRLGDRPEFSEWIDEVMTNLEARDGEGPAPESAAQQVPQGNVIGRVAEEPARRRRRWIFR